MYVCMIRCYLLYLSNLKPNQINQLNSIRLSSSQLTNNTNPDKTHQRYMHKIQNQQSANTIDQSFGTQHDTNLSPSTSRLSPQISFIYCIPSTLRSSVLPAFLPSDQLISQSLVCVSNIRVSVPSISSHLISLHPILSCLFCSFPH